VPFPNPDTQFKKGVAPNPNGRPKGSLSLSTHIQKLLNDEEFTLENFLFNGKTFKGAPIKAIITVAIMQAMQGDNKWAEWLAKHGYGTGGDPGTVNVIIPIYGGISGRPEEVSVSGHISNTKSIPTHEEN
jgi:hypothetical protein